ncbi:MFS transporter [Paenibacillus chartarius]|uniref:MFS transporter n=1 Tax=Paenibacillus chartarius TaxID=747481 RepID=A0ABV6DM48_9BACL
MNVKNNVRLLYACRFFQSLIPAYVIERLFWEQRGMTIPMVVYTELIFAVTVMLLEVPTGIAADRLGRRRLLILSALMGCFEFVILVYASQFWHFAAVVVIAGIARSAASGAENALLYDTLLQHGQEARFERHLGRMQAIDLTAAVLAALCGSLLASRFELELNYWISACAAGIALCVTLLLAEPRSAVSGEAAEPAAVGWGLAWTVPLRFFRKNPGVRSVVLCGIVAGAAMSYIYEFWQLYLERLNIEIAYFGLVSAVLMLIQLPGSIFAHRLKGRIRYRTLLTGIIAVFAAGFLYAAWAKDITGLAAMMLVCFVSGLLEPLTAGYLHHRIDSSLRATADSFQSLGENAVLMLSGLGFGYMSSRYDIFGGYGWMAAVCGAWLIYMIAAGGRKIED